MPREPWQPLPHEADLFYNVYIDESSQNKHRYLVLGGLTVPLDKAAAFEAHIAASREPMIAPTNPDGTPRVIKWEKVKNYNLAAYKKVVAAFFSAMGACLSRIGPRIDAHCLVVDTTLRDLKAAGDGDTEIGFNKQIYFLCAVMIRTLHPKELFHLYLDRLTTKQPLGEAQKIMNAAIMKRDNKAAWPIRRLRFEDPERCQALQVIDIIIGALAYRLNGHYVKPDANPAKKALSDYILREWCKIRDPFANTRYKSRVAIMHRASQRAPGAIRQR
jgi:hypothetical protein